MKLSQVLDTKGRRVQTARADETVHTAITKLVQLNIGSLVVVDASDRLIGILTERDVLRLSAKSAGDLSNMRVRDHMTRGLITANLNATVDDALAVMTEKRIRHLPVLDGDRLEGLISVGDLVKAKLEEAQHETKQLTDFVMGKYPG